MIREAESSGLSLSSLIPSILRIAVKQLGANTGTLILMSPEGIVEQAWGLDLDNNSIPADAALMQRIVSEGAAGYALKSKEPIVIDNTLTDPRWLRRRSHNTSAQASSALCVPMQTLRSAVGTVTICKDGVGQFSKLDAELLHAIADHAAVALENARLYHETQRQLEITTLINEASKAITASLDLDEILILLLSQINGFFDAEAISIALLDEQTNELVFHVAEGIGAEELIGRRMPAYQGIAGWAIWQNRAALVNDVRSDPRFNASIDGQTGLETTAILCAPLSVLGEPIGTIQVINPKSGTFNRNDEVLIKQLANIASSGIANAQQFARTQFAEERYASLFEDSVNPVVLTDLNGVITDMNRRAAQLIRQNISRLKGHPIDVLHQNKVWVDHTFGHSLSLQTGENVVENHVILPDNSTVPVEIHMKRISSVDSGVIQWIYYDRTKQLELEQLRRDLTAMLFHDLQNPLSNVISSLELLRLEMDESDGLSSLADSMLTIAGQSSQRLRHLITSLLEISQLESDNPVIDRDAVEPVSIAEAMVHMFSTRLSQKDVTLRVRVPEDLPAVDANRDMIERVAMNLLDNALKFSNEGQLIRLTGEVCHTNQFVCFTVSDSGPGIPPEERQKVFQKYHRLRNNKHKGLGLGLSFCQLAVQAHGGEIWVERSAMGGAAFRFSLPIATQAA